MGLTTFIRVFLIGKKDISVLVVLQVRFTACEPTLYVITLNHALHSAL